MSNHNTPFSQQIAFMSRGVLDAELTEELASVVKAVRETGKAGEITLKIKVRKLDNRNEDAVRLTPVVSAKVPQLPPYDTIMFSTGDGDLLRDDPHQQKLPLQEVKAQDRGPIHHVGTAGQQ